MRDLEIFNKSILKVTLGVLLVSLAAFALYFRLSWIFQNEYPQTTDGFFYLQEIKHRLQTGQGYYVGFSPFFKLIEIFSQITSLKSETQIYRILVILSLFFFSSALIIPVANKNYYWLIPGLFLIPWISDVIFFRHYAFVKQAFSLSIFLLGYSLYLRFASRESRNLNIASVFAFILIAVGVSTHLFTAAIFTGLLLYELFFKPGSRKYTLFFSALLIGVLVASVFFREKDILNIWPINYSLSWIYFCQKTTCYQYDYIEYILYMALFLYLIVGLSFAKKINQSIILFIVGYFVLNLPIWSIDSQFVYRAAFSSVWLIIYAFSMAFRHDAPLKITACIGLLAILILAYPNSTHLIPREILMPSQQLLKFKKPLQSWIPEEAFVHAPHAMQFKVSYFLDRKSSKNFADREKGRPFITFANPDLKTPESCLSIESESDVPDSAAPCVSIQKGWRFIRQE